MQHSLVEYIELGGIVMYILVALNMISLSVLLWKFIQLYIEKNRAKEVFLKILNSMLAKYPNASLKDLENSIYSDVSKYLLSCESGFSTIKIIATIAPILGLLGTVIGVLDSFETIAATGFSKGVNSFASGISLALITTIGGLIVALPAYIGYNYLVGLLTRLEAKYEELINDRILHEKKLD